MNFVNEVKVDGLLVLFIKDILLVFQVNFQVKEFVIYYGEKIDIYIFMGMSIEEFDYFWSGENVFIFYSGMGGVLVNFLW